MAVTAYGGTIPYPVLVTNTMSSYNDLNYAFQNNNISDLYVIQIQNGPTICVNRLGQIFCWGRNGEVQAGLDSSITAGVGEPKLVDSRMLPGGSGGVFV